jgi:hypothetical protein
MGKTKVSATAERTVSTAKIGSRSIAGTPPMPVTTTDDFIPSTLHLAPEYGSPHALLDFVTTVPHPLSAVASAQTIRRFFMFKCLSNAWLSGGGYLDFLWPPPAQANVSALPRFPFGYFCRHPCHPKSYSRVQQKQDRPAKEVVRHP